MEAINNSMFRLFKFSLLPSGHMCSNLSRNFRVEEVPEKCGVHFSVRDKILLPGHTLKFAISIFYRKWLYALNLENF